ncbi:MAG TPA: DUF4249 family protein [Rhodothermales bacterium]|nr:DUF4249 family protein [Rhodothermales bacterium]
MKTFFRQVKTMSLFLLIGLLGGCDTYQQDSYKKQYVVQGYLIALEPLSPISVSTTVPLNEIYSLEATAVKNAKVEVQLLNAQGQPEKTFDYVADPDSVSMFKPLDTTALVMPSRTYALRITFPDKPDVITAKTVIPDTMRVIRTNGDTFRYQQQPQFEQLISPSLNPSRQSYFIFSVEGLTPSSTNLVPFWDPENGFGGDRKPPKVYASPILNEANYRTSEGNLLVQLPWLTVVYFGKNRVTTTVLDDATYNFFRTQSVQLGGSTLSPGEIPNAVTNIVGGTGVFGSLARATSLMTVTR